MDAPRTRPGRSGTILRYLLSLWVCTGLLLPHGAGAEPKPEAQVKAAFLVNFPKFIDWPQGAFPDDRSPLAICILGDDPFGATLDELVRGEAVNGHRLVVQRIRGAPKPKACQVLYVGKDEKNAPEVLAGLGPGVLTVGERAGFLQEGGIIAFVIEQRHVRFDINQRAAASASLTLSARLLNVARSVEK